jgi:hypothetical protein
MHRGILPRLDHGSIISKKIDFSVDFDYAFAKDSRCARLLHAPLARARSPRRSPNIEE